MVEISESYQGFISSHDHAPEFLYLGDTAYRAFLVLIERTAMDINDIKQQRKPYMGMKVMHIINNDLHIKCG